MFDERSLIGSTKVALLDRLCDSLSSHFSVGDVAVVILQPGESHSQAYDRAGVTGNEKYCLSINIYHNQADGHVDDIDAEIARIEKELENYGLTKSQIRKIAGD